jgi:hypothetical protein
MKQRKNSYIQTDAHSRSMLNTPEFLPRILQVVSTSAPCPMLSTKVLADMLTIDEFLQGCSNPKVEPLETEVYG